MSFAFSYRCKKMACCQWNKPQNNLKSHCVFSGSKSICFSFVEFLGWLSLALAWPRKKKTFKINEKKKQQPKKIMTRWNLTWLLNQLSPVGKVGDVVLWDSLSVSISCLHVHLILIQKSSSCSASFSCSPWFWQLGELKVTAGMMSWAYYASMAK